MSDLLTELRRRDITLWRDGNNLRFSAPAGALTPELRAEMGARKSELLETLLQEREAEETIPQTDRNSGSPLSFSQEPLWILDQIAPGLATYNIELCWRILGVLNVEALESSLNEISRRHEILRTRIERDAQGNLKQFAMPHTPHAIPIVEAGTAQLEQFAAQEFSRPFDLASGPMMRAVLVRFSEGDHALLLAWHHIAFDGGSQSVFFRELAALYTAFRERCPSPLPELPIQFGDYACWQREAFSRSHMQGQLAYWRTQLAGDRPPLALPTDRPRPAQQSYRGATRSREFSPALTAQLRRLAREEGITLFMLLLAGFKTLLARYSGEFDICIGSPIAQRTRVETEGLIGFFVNMLALRTDLTGDPTFREIVHRVRATTLEAFEHQDVPFEKIVEALNPTRHFSHQPIFQIAFALESGGDAVPELPSLCIEPIRVPGTTAKFDLTLSIAENADGLRATMEYSTDLFDAGTIDRLLNSLDLLLQSAVTEPNTRLSRIPILCAAERERILMTWNDTAREYPHDLTVSALFEKCVAQTPTATALIDNTERFTYAALNARANAIAHDLQIRGVIPSSLVGIPAERSARFIFGVLGILKAGGAYVPLDPAEPPERLDTMRSRCTCVLDFDALPATNRDENPANTAGAGDAAYVLFTSGSTGAPKGVVVPHRAINRLVINNDYAPFAADDVVAFASNVCFDAATFEIWGALLNGGTLVVTSRDVLLSPVGLAAHLADHHVSVLFLTTSLFNRLAHESPAMFSTLRHLVFGGEAADAASVRIVLERGKPGRVVNGYGPTEATTFAVCHRVESIEGETVPIGRPITNTTAYILDSTMQPVPVGVTGDLYLGGPGLAIGYHDAPELTAQRFLETNYGRLYKTGDLARWRPDGLIDYHGRTDTQIKLRGFRIEPGEIEATLKRHPGVRQAALIVHQNGEDRSLVAYLVPMDSAVLGDAEMREFSRQRLPSPMVPAAFVCVPALPLTPNGKLDQRALPEPPVARTAPSEFPAQRDPVQSQLVAIWEEVLNRRPISIRDGFFELGGHSLLAARIISLIADRMGKRIGFGEFFDNPTIEKHALRLAAANVPARQPPYTSINPSGKKTPCFFFHGDVLGGGLFSKLLARELGADRPFYAIHPHGLQGDDVPQTVEAMATERLQWIRKVQPTGPYILGGYCNGSLVAYQAARLLRKSGEQVAPVLMLNADGSNLRFRLLQRLCAIGSALRHEDEQAKRRRFLKIRDTICNRETLAHYYAKAAADLLKQSPGVQVTRLWRKVCRVLRRFVPKSLRSSPDAPTAPKPRHKEAIMNVYDDVCRAHLPGHYDSAIVLLWPREQPVPGSHGPATGWEKLCPQIEIVEVPGDHLSCVAESAHVTAIGEAMKKNIARAENLPHQTSTQIS